MRLSSTTVDVSPDKLHDYGSTVGTGDGDAQPDALPARRAGRWCSAPARSSGPGGSTASTTTRAAAPDPRMQQATVNLLADMGAQPATLQAGLVAATRLDRHDGADLDDHLAAASGAALAAGAADHDHRDGHRRRRRGRRGRGLDRRRRDLAPGDRPRTLDLHLDADRARADDAADARGRRQRQHRDARGRRDRDGRGAHLPLHDLERDRRARRPGASPTRARSSSASSSGPTSPASSPACASTRAPTNTGTHVGHLWSADRDAAGDRDLHRRDGAGWQQVAFASPVAITANTTYVASYVAPERPLRRRRGYFAAPGLTARRCTRWPTARTVPTVSTRGASGFPTSDFTATNYWVDVIFS